MENVATQNKYTSAQTILIGFNIIDNSGFYIKDRREWRRKAKVDKISKFRSTLQEHSKKPELTPENNKDEQQSKAKIIKNMETELPRIQSHEVFLPVMEFSSKVSTDQTGQFPITSARVYKYMMVAYAQDSNAIMIEPIKSRENI